MTPRPRTQYAKSDGLSIAYQVFGEGDQDLLMVPGVISHVELAWESESSAAFLSRLANTFRLIRFDKRGQGMSDRFEGAPSLEQRIDDLRAVLTAADSKRASIFALSEGGPMSILFAATYPHLVERLVLCATMARYEWAEDYPHRPRVEDRLASRERSWGTGKGLETWAPSLAHDPEAVEFAARMERMSATPTGILNLMRANARIDVRSILPEVRVPVLLIHRRDDKTVSVGNARYLADHIPDATYLELPGIDHLPWVGDSDSVVEAIVSFAMRRSGTAGIAVDSRRLATALFTDIEESTNRMAELGDRRWHELLDRHDEVARKLVREFQGQFIKSTGDGILAIFDGPSRAVKCAIKMITSVEQLGLRVRAGLHAGEIEHRANSDLTGLAVHVAARVMAAAEGGKVLVTKTLVDIISGGDIEFASRGVHELKGIPEPTALYEPLTDDMPPD